MKRIHFIVITVLSVALVITGCCATSRSSNPVKTLAANVVTQQPNTSNTAEPSAESTEAIAPTSVPTAEAVAEKTDVIVGEVATLNGMALQVTKVEKSKGTKFDKPGSGKEYVIVSVKIKNVGENVLSYNPFYFKMQNSQGQINSTSISLVGLDTALSSGELMTGGLVSGTIVFEEPKNDKSLQFIYEDISLFSDKKISVDLSKTADKTEPLDQDFVQAEDEKIVNIGEENTLGNTTIKLNKVTKSAGDGFSKAKSGMEYVIVDITIKNIGTDSISYNPLYFMMRNSKGQQEGMTIVTFLTDSALNSGELASGGTVTGTIVFEEPKGDKGLVLIYQETSLFDTDYIAFKVQ